ncbi:TPA: hypothetical protein F3L05_15870 [Aeromonas hydrophila]|nr:hypothetical protein [Aeromonas hydrophila]
MSSTEVKPESKFDLLIKKTTPVFLLGHAYLFYVIFTYSTHMHILNYLFVILWPLINITVALVLLITMRWKYFSINTLLCTVAIFSPMYLSLYFR